MTLDPAVGALLAGCFALLFASAALHKLVDGCREDCMAHPGTAPAAPGADCVETVGGRNRH